MFNEEFDDATTEKRSVYVDQPTQERAMIAKRQPWLLQRLNALVQWLETVFLHCRGKQKHSSDNSHKAFEVLREPFFCEETDACLHVRNLLPVAGGWQCPVCHASYYLKEQLCLPRITVPIMRGPITPIVPTEDELTTSQPLALVPIDASKNEMTRLPVQKIPYRTGALARGYKHGTIKMNGPVSVSGLPRLSVNGVTIHTGQLERISQQQVEEWQQEHSKRNCGYGERQGP